VRFPRSRRAAFVVCATSIALTGLARNGFASGIEDGVKAMQAGDIPKAEKDLQPLAKERDPRAEFLLGLYIYGNPDSKLFDMGKAVPLLLDAAERGYTPALIPLAGAYADGKGVPKSVSEAYKWLIVAQRWNVPNADQLIDQLSHDLKPDEIEQAKAAGTAYTFKTK
jgi:hypothetical protein